jgi:polynucleotide 5'-kinase involved in rRNA processing
MSNSKNICRQRQVAFLDCDVGQPEFTPQGLVSLSLLSEPILGPPCSHSRIPEYARFFGAPSAKQDPDEYMALLMELFHVYQVKYRHVELVVNTSGWIRGRERILIR